MKGYLFLIFVFMFIVLNDSCFGQAKTEKDIFPSYDQIKPSKDNIVTYGGPANTIIVEKKVINLFDYLEGTVIYILNGKLSTDVNYIKQVLSEKENDIEFISVGKPNPAGKRVIEIKYNLL